MDKTRRKIEKLTSSSSVKSDLYQKLTCETLTPPWTNIHYLIFFIFAHIFEILFVIKKNAASKKKSRLAQLIDRNSK